LTFSLQMRWSQSSESMIQLEMLDSSQWVSSHHQNWSESAISYSSQTRHCFWKDWQGCWAPHQLPILSQLPYQVCQDILPLSDESSLRRSPTGLEPGEKQRRRFEQEEENC
jgi:hypothetical protein